ncbi:cytochrome b5-like heme/steroid binding domain-containing protein [Trichoderma velutinum]
MSKLYTWSELQQYNKPNDLRIVIRGSVYDVTEFQNEHPGGPEFLLDQGGGDVTELFEDAGHSDEARSLMKNFQVGVIEKKTNDKGEISLEQRRDGDFVGFGVHRHILPVIFVFAIGMLFRYFYGPTGLLPT